MKPITQQPFMAQRAFEINSSMQRGFAMILSVLTLATIGVAISSTLLLLSVANSQTALSSQDAQFAKSLANTCAELGLEGIIASASYTGSGSHTLLTGSCTFSVSAYDAYSSVVVATGVANQATRKVRVLVKVPSRTIMSWQEVADYSVGYMP